MRTVGEKVISMNYNEYCESVKHVEISDSLVFKQAIMWLHPEILPIGLVSIGDDDLSIVKVPEETMNRFGRTVPVIAISPFAFAGKVKITDIILSPRIERLPAGAFAGCAGLRNIVIPKTIKKIRHLEHQF